MKFFPFALIDYANTQGIPIGWDDYKPVETPPDGYLAEGCIAIEKVTSGNVPASPEYETWVLMAVIRHNDWGALTGDGGLVDQFINFLKTLKKKDIGNRYAVEDVIIPIDQEDVLTGENYYYYVNELTFKVLNKSKR